MRLKSKLDEGKFAILAEMEPPKGVDVSTMVANATRVKERVDAFVVPDMNDAVLRMSSLGGALILKEKGMEPVMQLSCRDRNRLALQVPGALIERLQNARDRVHECMRIVPETASTLREEGFGGVHLSTVGWEDKLPEILEGIGI